MNRKALIARVRRTRAIRAFLLVFWIILLSVGQSQLVLAAADEWKAAHTQAMTWAREEKYEQALLALTQLQAKYPAVTRIYFDRAVVLQWAGKDKEATSLYETKISGIKDIPIYVKAAIADAYFRQMNFAAARNLYHAVAATGDRGARLLEAEVLIRQNDPAEAQKIYEAFLKENPNDIDVYLSRGRARLGNGDGRRAIEDFEAAQVLALKQGDVAKKRQIDALLASACIRANDSARAVLVLQPYIQTGQADPAMQADYVAGLCATGTLDQAIAEANRFWPNLDLAPTFGVRSLADAYLFSGNFDQAIRVYSLVLKREPKNHLALLGLAPAKIQKGQVAEALLLYDQVIALNQKLAEIVLNDCLYYMSTGNTDTAKRIFAVVRARIPAKADFYRQYGERLNSPGLPKDSYKNSQILRSLP